MLRSYLADIQTTLGQVDPPRSSDPGPWSRATGEARAAVYNVRKSLPLLADKVAARPEPKLTWAPAQNLDDAVTAMAVGRDLLQAHFETAHDGVRRANSQWARHS